MHIIQKILISASLTVLAACVTSPTSPAGITFIGATRMTKLVEVSTPQMLLTETGTLKAWINIKNRTKSKLMLEGRATFTDNKDQPIEQPTGWQPIFIEGESNASLQFLSMSSSAKRVNIELREGNR